MKKLDALVKELEESFFRWKHLKKHGGSDPTWEDGGNMNLVRNHIFYTKAQIKELCEDEGLELPEVYYKKVPLIIREIPLII